MLIWRQLQRGGADLVERTGWEAITHLKIDMTGPTSPIRSLHHFVPVNDPRTRTNDRRGYLNLQYERTFSNQLTYGRIKTIMSSFPASPA